MNHFGRFQQAKEIFEGTGDISSDGMVPRLIIGFTYVYTSGYSPNGTVGRWLVGLLGTAAVVLPVLSHCPDGDEVGTEREVPSLPSQTGSPRITFNHTHGDRWVRFLDWAWAYSRVLDVGLVFLESLVCSQGVN